MTPSQKFESSKCRAIRGSRQCRECPHALPSIPSYSHSAVPFSLHGARDQLVRGRKLSQCSTKWPRLMRSADSQPARRRASQAVKRPHLGHARAQTTDATILTSPWPRPHGRCVCDIARDSLQSVSVRIKISNLTCCALAQDET